MDKFLTYQGTQPIYLGDVNFVQAAAADQFGLLARALMNSASAGLNAILQGVEVTIPSEGTVAYSSGIVVINGEILPVTGDTLSLASSAPLYLHVQATLSGPRTFKDGVTHACYETRKAYVDGSSEDGVALSSLKRLSYRLEDATMVSDVATGGFIRAATLYRKKDFWFIDITFEPQTGDNVIDGTVTFSAEEGLTADLFNDIPEGSFGALIRMAETNVYAHTTCTVTKNTGNMTVTIAFSNSTVLSVSSSTAAIAYMNAMLLP